MSSIDLNAVNALRGYEVQHFISLQGLFYVLSLQNKFFSSIIVEGNEDIEIRGLNRRMMIQVKKNEQLGQWIPSEIYKIASNMFFKWSKSTPIFKKNCKDSFYLVLQGNISGSVFYNREDFSKCIISLEQLFNIPTCNSLKENSKIKKGILDIISAELKGFERSKLNYFIHNLRICTHLPNLEDLKIVIFGRIQGYLKYMTTNISQQYFMELTNQFLNEIKSRVTSRIEGDHKISYEYIKEKFDFILENNIDSYIERLDRYRDIELTNTVLKEKFIHVHGNINKIIHASYFKNNFLKSLILNRITLNRLKQLYSEYISWIKLQTTPSRYLSLDEINQIFIDIHAELFQDLESIKNITALKGIFFDLVSYCTFQLEGIADVL